jgi:hypothetical protein
MTLQSNESLTEKNNSDKAVNGDTNATLEDMESQTNSEALGGETEELRHIAATICDALEQLTDSDNRQIAELFLELPSAEEYPDYYETIDSPISMQEIRAKSYQSIDEIVKDFKTMFKNARIYNDTKMLKC